MPACSNFHVRRGTKKSDEVREKSKCECFFGVGIYEGIVSKIPCIYCILNVNESLGGNQHHTSSYFLEPLRTTNNSRKPII
jgi:hypothetical protein